MPRHAGIFQSWGDTMHQILPTAAGTAGDATGHHRAQSTSPRGRKQIPVVRGKEVGMVTAEGGAEGNGSCRAPGETQGADGGQAWAGETGGNQVRGRPGAEKGGAEIKALQTRSIVLSGPRGAAGRLSQPSGLHPARSSPAAGPRLRRGPGRSEPHLGDRRPFRAALTSATAASRSAPRSVTGSCRRAPATAARLGLHERGERAAPAIRRLGV